MNIKTFLAFFCLCFFGTVQASISEIEVQKQEEFRTSSFQQTEKSQPCYIPNFTPKIFKAEAEEDLYSELLLSGRTFQSSITHFSELKLNGNLDFLTDHRGRIENSFSVFHSFW